MKVVEPPPVQSPDVEQRLTNSPKKNRQTALDRAVVRESRNSPTPLVLQQYQDAYAHIEDPVLRDKTVALNTSINRDAGYFVQTPARVPQTPPTEGRLQSLIGASNKPYPSPSEQPRQRGLRQKITERLSGLFCSHTNKKTDSPYIPTHQTLQNSVKQNRENTEVHSAHLHEYKALDILKLDFITQAKLDLYGNTTARLSLCRQTANQLNSHAFSEEVGDYREVCLSDLDLRGATLQNVYFSRAYLNAPKISDVECDNSTFKYAVLTNGSAQRSKFNSCSFSHAQLSGMDFTGTSIINSSLESANISEANFSSVNFSGSDLTEVNFDGCDFTSANFSGVKMTTGTAIDYSETHCFGGILRQVRKRLGSINSIDGKFSELRDNLLDAELQAPLTLMDVPMSRRVAVVSAFASILASSSWKAPGENIENFLSQFHVLSIWLDDNRAPNSDLTKVDVVRMLGLIIHTKPLGWTTQKYNTLINRLFVASKKSGLDIVPMRLSYNAARDSSQALAKT